MEGSISRRSAVVIILVAAIVGFGLFALLLPKKNVPPAPEPVVQTVKKVGPEIEVIGKSVEGRNIEAFTYRLDGVETASSTKHLLFVGGMHGGYEWNSVILAYSLVDYLTLTPSVIPEGVIVTVIPNLNPDGVFKVVGKEGRFAVEDIEPAAKVPQEPGRLNAHDVDLNRNFGCKWDPKGTWRSKTVSTGSEAFSEPESSALRDYVFANHLSAVVFFHSQANAVYGSECKKGVLPETLEILNTYSKATGYKAIPAFTDYPVTGDAEGWLASINIPAITVELKSHEAIEWEKNLLGVKALLEYYK